MTAAWPSQSGEMGARVRAFDWSQTSLGPLASWPLGLRTLVDLVLSARQPGYIVWGPTLTLLYNDAFISILGTKHPAALGQSFGVVWAELLAEFRPLLDATLAGEAQHFVDRPVALEGHPGRPLRWFTFAWTPVRDESGTIAGIHCTATETTDKVQAEQALRESETAARRTSELRYRSLFNSIDEGFCIIEVRFDAEGRGIDYRFVEVNPAFEQQTGLR